LQVGDKTRYAAAFRRVDRLTFAEPRKIVSSSQHRGMRQVPAVGRKHFLGATHSVMAGTRCILPKAVHPRTASYRRPKYSDAL
jgi:hypothetical protein